MQLGIDDLVSYATGAAFLGTGGGGDPYIGRLMLQQQLANGGQLSIIEPDELDDDALVVATAGMGAPTVMIEKIPSLDAAEVSLRALEKYIGRRVDALICVEAGGINGTLPLAQAAKMNLPIVNGDGMGRAFPELQMVTFGIAGERASPLALATEKDDVVVVDTQDNHFAETLARANVVAMGALAQVSLYPMSGAAIKRTCVPRTITLALNIGRTIHQARRARHDPFEALVNYFRQEIPARFAGVLFDGKVVDVLRETKSGFAKGQIVLQALGDSDEQLAIDFQNEFLCARRAGQLVAIVPDLIAVLDRETAEPITTEALKFGQRVKVIGVSVPSVMRTPSALATFGPAAFGYDDDYVPIEELP